MPIDDSVGVDHDRLFKELLTTFFADFIELFLPQMALYIDGSSLEFLDKEIFTDVTAGDVREADLVVKARFKGSDSFFIVHTETQAQRQPEFGRRLFSYFARLHEKYALPVYPVAVLSFDRPRTQQPSMYEVRFPDLEVLRFNYAVIQLNQLDWRQYLKHSNPVAAALMAKMRVAPSDRLLVQFECVRMLLRLRLDPARARLITGFVNTYLQVTALEMKQLKVKFKQLSPKEQEAYMETTTPWTELGRQEGRQEGRREEAVALVTRQLQRRFGSIEVCLSDQVCQLSLEKMESLSEALLDFTAVADLQQWLATQKS